MKRWFARSGWCSGIAIALALSAAAVPAEEAGVARLEIQIVARKVQGDNDTRRVTEGQTVEMVWSSDEAGRLHLHGYELEFEVTPERPTVVRFAAHATGRFPVTSHGFGGAAAHGHETLLYLEVLPD